jgi:N-acyl homoserine lactone hydrolase
MTRGGPGAPEVAHRKRLCLEPARWAGRVHGPLFIEFLRQSHPVERPPGYKDGSMSRFVHHVHDPADGGEVRRLDLGFFVRPASETGTGAARVEPAYGYLVSSPALTICFDTGIGAADAETNAHYQPLRRPLEEALAAVGASSDDVDLVVNSHLHFDHCGGNPSLRGRPIVVQAPELEAARQSGYTFPELVDFPGAAYRELDGEVELAAGVIVLPTPGHSPGHQSLVVSCKDGTVIVAGQATDYAFEYGSHRLARKASIELGRTVVPSPEWVERLEAFDPARVVFAHDGAVWEP